MSTVQPWKIKTIKGKIAFIFAIICIAMWIQPVLNLANRVEPWVLGYPFLWFWMFLWWFIATVGLIITYLAKV